MNRKQPTLPTCGIRKCFWHKFHPKNHPVIGVLFDREFLDIVTLGYTESEIARLNQIVKSHG